MHTRREFGKFFVRPRDVGAAARKKRQPGRGAGSGRAVMVVLQALRVPAANRRRRLPTTHGDVQRGNELSEAMTLAAIGGNESG